MIGIEGVFGNCEDVNTSYVGNNVGEFISPEEAAARYYNRLNRKNPIGGHLVSISKLREFLDALDSIDTDEPIDFVRIWKGTSNVYGTCKDGSHENEFHLEDLIMVPTFADGRDVHATDVSEDAELSKAVILSSLIPCPKWCGPRGERYFHERFEERRSTDNPCEEKDPYKEYINCPVE